MPEKIYILGAGGLAKEVLNIYIDCNRTQQVQCFIEDNCQRQGYVLNGIVIKDQSILQQLNKKDSRLICAIGSPKRKKLIESMKNMGFTFDTIIHPSVIKSKWIEIGEGSIICAGNILTSQIIIGKYNIINLNCTIGHDVKTGDYVSVMPGVNISGNVTLNNSAYIGTNACILEGKSIGENSIIGAGAVVTTNIPDNVVAGGIPAKIIKENES